MNNLDIYQRQAVLSTHRNTVVTACPGAGKTTVICGRILHLQDLDGVTDIILITYTNAAANEFRKRLPAHALARLRFSGTIHGFAKWFIETYCRNPDGKETVVTVMDEEETMEQIEALAKHLGLKLTKTAMKEIARRTDDPPVGVCHDPADNLYRAHVKKQWDSARFSFSGLIATARREMNRAGAETFDLVVDEYQDASSATHELLEALPCVSRFYVGDANQSIFGFIGGSPERLLGLAAKAQSDPENWTHVQLENTYRCAAEIAEAANEVVARTPSRTVMASRSGIAGFVRYNAHATSAQEMVTVATEVIEHRGEYEDTIAVLCRTNAQCEEMRTLLKTMGVPVTERVRRDQMQGLRQALTILDYLANPTDEGRIEAVNKLVLTPTKFAQEKQTALRECRMMETPGKDFVLLSVRIHDPALRIPNETMDAIDQAKRSLPSGATLGDLALLLRSPNFEAEPSGEPGQCTVTTAHGAKGMEWDAVWIVGCNECYWKGNRDEERRLFYVALTRARVLASVSWAKLCSREAKGIVLDPVVSEPIGPVVEHLERTRKETSAAADKYADYTVEIDKGPKLRKSSTSEFMGLGDDSGEERPI